MGCLALALVQDGGVGGEEGGWEGGSPSTTSDCGSRRAFDVSRILLVVYVRLMCHILRVWRVRFMSRIVLALRACT